MVFVRGMAVFIYFFNKFKHCWQVYEYEDNYFKHADDDDEDDCFVVNDLKGGCK